LSAPAVATVAPSGEKASALMDSLWPGGDASGRRVATS
jgi:hypothetical protein